MNKQTLRADGFLFLAALIWGFAFVAQRSGMEHVGPFLFNGIRFLLGALVLLPFLKIFKGGKWPRLETLLIGSILFVAASLQQAGLVYTTAGKAGFITGLYVILVPILGIPLGHRTRRGSWVGALLAVWGMYFLSVQSDFSVQFGDLLVLVGALFWAMHVLYISHLLRKYDALKIAIAQFAVCGLLSMLVAILAEPLQLTGIWQASGSIAYAGIFSVGVAYTLQVVAQNHAQPAHAAILLSLETVFAVLGGWWLLNEALTLRMLLGCSLMLAGMLVSQISEVYGKPLETTNS
ncbi:MAG: DMT family transporter [Calditrichia bacterium]